MYHRILVVVADHPSSQVAIAHGLGLARALGAELLFAHALHSYPLAVADVAPVVTIAPDEFARQAAELGARLLKEAREQALGAGVKASALVLDAVNGVSGLATLAREHGCDLIIVGSEGGNALVRLLTGSAVSGLITRADVPVMVCHARDAPPPT
ncbi:MAG TPA: universal stress protein [Rubrivivax sp.]|nr:universal stress protein [Burkholderiales bacterium]HNT40472.1 universal stress protein [Rubrivivax sp.]